MLLTTGQELGSQADLFPSDIDEIANHQTPKERSSQGSSRTVKEKNKNLNSKLRGECDFKIATKESKSKL